VLILRDNRRGAKGGQRGNEIATVPFDLPSKLQGEQSRPHLPGRSFRQAGKFVHRHRHRSQKGGKPLLDRFRPPGGLFRGRPSAAARGDPLSNVGLPGHRRKRNCVLGVGKVEFIP
jgi:hypothetical protein